MEIVSRPQPREGGAAGVARDRRAAGRGDRARRRAGAADGRRPTSSPRRSAAGRSSRIAAEAARGEPGRSGRRRHRPRARHGCAPRSPASTSLSSTIPTIAEGLSTSLRRGIAALPDDVDGAVVLLADMPGVDAGDGRPADRGLRSGGRHADRRADLRRQARQPGAVVAAAVRRTRRPSPATPAAAT